MFRPKKLSFQLTELASQFGGKVVGEAKITGVSLNTARLEKGDLFMALPGKIHHGANFANDAIKAGAAAIVTDREGEQLLPEGLPRIILANPKRHLFGLSKKIYGYQPSIPILGVTGTNGKTSTVHYLEKLANRLGQNVFSSGSSGMRFGSDSDKVGLTTPEINDLVAGLSYAIEKGATIAMMEVSAQALVRGRVDGLRFSVSGFTNLSHDHLDDFGDMDSYLAAKAKLFEPEVSELAVIFTDTRSGQRLRKVMEIPSVSLGTEEGSQLRFSSRLDGDNTRVEFPGRGISILSENTGLLMAQNLALAIGMIAEQGIEGLEAIDSLDGFVPGRLEKVHSGPDVYLDYAHTPEAIALALKELKGRYKKVHALIGFSGERDHSKRKPMVEFATSADRVIATTQHPRSEGEKQIIADILRHKSDMETSEDPVEGLKSLAQGVLAEDCVVWFGPGNLEYREFVDGKREFLPRVVISEVFDD